MRGDSGVLDFLAKAIRSELAAHNQYVVHAAWLENRGYAGLARHELTESEEERKHLLRYVGRLVFLEGVPNLQELDPLRIGSDVPSIIASDLAAEMDAVALYVAAAKYCESVGDFVTRDMFVATLRDEQGHVNFLETQRVLIADLGVSLYAQKFVDELEG